MARWRSASCASLRAAAPDKTLFARKKSASTAAKVSAESAAR
jgi:hypothetical protein